MNSPEEIKNSENVILAEYSALRDEIVARINLRHQMLVIALTLLGLLMAFGIKDTNEKEISMHLFLLYPILCMFLAMGWAHTDYRLGELGTYIRETIETKFLGIGWEHYIHARSQPFKRSFKVQEMAAIGIFVGVEVLSLLVALFLEFSRNKPFVATSVQTYTANLVLKSIFLGLSIIAIGFTIFLIKKRRKHICKEQKHPAFLKIARDAIVVDKALQSGS